MDVQQRFAALQQAMLQEQQFWRALDPVSTCPLEQMLQAALVVRNAAQARQSELQTLLEEWQKLFGELEAEKELVKRSATLPEVLANLSKALDESETAHELVEEAFKKWDKAKRKSQPFAEAEQVLREARRHAREMDKLLSGRLAGLGALMEHFPEVAEDPTMKQVGHSLPKELMKVWKGCLSLDSFDSHAVHGTHRHPVYRVEANGQSFALKEYTIDDASLRTCTKEAALLMRLSHPHVVEITAVFTDAAKRKLYLQMPWYQEGTLRDWVQNRQPPTESICRALSQVLGALSHMHHRGVVHCDVKPENIFVDQDGVAFLGDLDVSIDAATRQSTVHQMTVRGTTRPHGQGFTPGYDAPELLRSGATAKTDVFAFGATLVAILPDNPLARQLAQRLMAESPEQRPTAREALRDAFFAQFVREVPQERSNCCLCFELVPLANGALCSLAHFTCQGCLGRHVASLLDTVEDSAGRLEQHRARGGRIPCPACLTDPSQEASVFTDEQLRGIEGPIFARYTAAKDAATENRLWVVYQDRFQAEVRRMRAEFQTQLDQVRQGQQQQHRELRSQAEEAATAEMLRRNFPNALQCPRCSRGPVLPEGCHDLRAHHGERRGRANVSNACRGCGFFAAERSAWAPWNGQMSP